jgi:hypothetical protein
VKRHLLAATALAGFAVAIGGDNLQAQVPGPGFSSSITGSVTTTSSTAVSIIAFSVSWPTSERLYIKSLQCSRNDAGTTAVKIALNDSATTTFALPNSGGGGFVAMTFEQPLVLAADTALTMTASATTTSMFCSAQAFLAN